MNPKGSKPPTKLVLTGDENVPAMPMNEAQVNHLRRLLAWMRCEWMLDDDMQRGFISGAESSVEVGAATSEEAGALLAKQAEGFYPISTDGLKRAENFRSCRATLRRIRGL